MSEPRTKSRAAQRVELMAGRLEREVREYWDWYHRAHQQHGALVSSSGHHEANSKAEDAKALRDLLREASS